MYEDKVLGYSVLTKADIEAIHEATLEVMAHGVNIFGKKAQEIYAGAGCEVDAANNIVKFPANVVNDAIASTPAEYTLCGRNPRYDTVIGGDKVAYTCFCTGVEMIDYETGAKRPSNLKDVGDISLFCDALPEIDILTVPVAARDVTAEIKDIYEAAAVLRNTEKHYQHDAENGKNANAAIEMAAAIVGGREKLRERPIITLGACANSPLQLFEHVGEILITTAEAGLPMNLLSMGLCGATTPMTLAGTLVCTNAEILAGLVLTQLVNKGNPFQYGTSTTIMDMQYTTSPVGAPEFAMNSVAVGQLCHYYGIPSFVGAT